MGIRDRITYVVDVFIHQLSNFHTLQAQRLDVVQAIVCKPELESIRNLLCKDKSVYLYVAQ